MTVADATKSGLAEKAAKEQQRPVPCAEERAAPETQPEDKDCEVSPCKAKFQIYGDATVPLPKYNQVDEAEMNKDIRVENKGNKTEQPKQNGTHQPRQCPFLSNGNHPAPETKPNKRSKEQANGKRKGSPQHSPPTETRRQSIVTFSASLHPEDGLLDSPADPPLLATAGAATCTADLAPEEPCWSPPPGAATCTADLASEEPCWSPPPGAATCPTDLAPEELIWSPPPGAATCPTDLAPEELIWSPPPGAATCPTDLAPEEPCWSPPPGAATCTADLAPEKELIWSPPPIDQRRRSQLFTALRNASRCWSVAGDLAATEAVNAVLYREHTELIVQRYCQPPDSQCGEISAVEFVLHGTLPVYVHDDLFLGPATLSREQMVFLIRAGQYHHGHAVACFYAYVYCYEFVFFCEYLRQVECLTWEARAVLKGVLQRAENMHLISNSATIFSLAPEAMFTQRSPFLYVARLFPMREPWEADLLCGMVNSRDLVSDAAQGWNREEHVLFTMHQDMLRQAQLQERPPPPFHPAVTQLPSSAAAFSEIEGELVQRLDSHGLVVFQERGASYYDVKTCCQFMPLGQLSTEEVLRRSVGRHALIHLFGDVFFLGAPPVDLPRGQIRYLRPAEVRVHAQVGFYFESPSYANFIWNTQQRVSRALQDACQLRAPQLSSEEVLLVRWVLQEWADTSRRRLFSRACQLARFGPYLLNEYGKMLWRVLSANNFERTALQLCTDLGEHTRSVLETALAEHNCLDGN